MNISSALQAAAATWEDVVRVNYVLPDRNDFHKCWPKLREVFGDARPAATMIQADLMEKSMKIEIEVTAHKKPSTKGTWLGILAIGLTILFTRYCLA